ncbi:MAG: glycosyl hydrolase, partial [Tannerella sp.]|nr:glycosyl hydrolase [Tannerella sp.]
GLLYQATVKDSRIVFPGGASYRLLALPNFETMTPALLRKIMELVNGGATVIGLPPKKSPSLSGYPACDGEVQTLAWELWGGVNPPATLTVRPFGRGKIIWGEELKTNADGLYPHYDVTAKILAESIPPDFTSPGQIRYMHRACGDVDIYFVSNRTDKAVDAVCTFRIAGKQPELWSPVTGKICALPQYADEKGLTDIPLRFDVHEGYFIVFRNSARKSSGTVNFPETKQLTVLDASWTVSFDPAWGGPESVVFDKLHDWTDDSDPGIKYYSGTAFYRQSFDMPNYSEGSELYLDLGKVKNMARVRLNGRDLGTAWTAPWRVDISKAVKPKDNTLEIEVVNLWPNRLIGDEQLPYDGPEHGRWPDWLLNGKPRTGGRYTFAAYRHYSKDSPLLESGLTGPVTIGEYVWGRSE